ncbi:hypothetical protein PG993_007302 [Apiospora rasikravindrae]|uniref:DUF7514 domain-containing protein n=1 Tax=Apiospora rasikravindrae TaxID=990691 RepID=A0ABR1SX42_9PEZI
MDIPPPIPPRPPGYEIHAPISPEVKSVKINPPLPPRPAPQQQQQQYQQGAWTGYAQPSYSFPTQAPPPQVASFPGDGDGGGGGGGGTSMARWTPLFHPDGAPTPLFEALMAAFFGRLDPGRAGHIRPETLSGFLDLNGFLTEHNIWKSSLKGSNFLYTSEDLADYELKACCEAWYFDHKTAVRHPGRNQIPYGGMPLLSLQGFTDMMAVESAGEPERAWRGLNAALRHYGIWSAMGPLPREVFLQDMPRQLQQRIEQVKIRSHRAAQERLDAAQLQCQIQAQGRQAALDLIDGPYYRRRY